IVARRTQVISPTALLRERCASAYMKLTLKNGESNFIIKLKKHFYMKPILFTLFFALTVGVSFAQIKSDSSGHLTFKGVSIDGTLNEFVYKMKQKGFTQIETKNGTTFLKGDFASYKNCIVGVSTLKKKDLVSKIAV